MCAYGFTSLWAIIVVINITIHENCKYLFRSIIKLVLCEIVSDGLFCRALEAGIAYNYRKLFEYELGASVRTLDLTPSL